MAAATREKASPARRRPTPTTAPRASPSSSRTWRRRLNRCCGGMLAVNFLLVWALPIAGMGQLFHLGLKKLLIPPYLALDRSATFRRLCEKYIYSSPKFADFGATALLTLLSVSGFFALILRHQLTHGAIPLWLWFVYNCSWAGFGGRVMGAAYTFAHKEGHNPIIYRKWIRRLTGNVFENWVGCLFGNVPYNFTTSHMHLHHRLDGGMGDSFYQWDLDRSSAWDFLLYVPRIFSHMVGVSSLAKFWKLGRSDPLMKSQFYLLLRGCFIYWLLVPAALYAVTRSTFFLMVVWLQPLLCMTFFLSIVNWGFHAFIAYDENGEQVPCVNSSTILNGMDDYFGEDDHMAHHYSPQTWYTKTHEFQARMHKDIVKHHGAVFKEVSIVELGCLVLFNQFERIAEKHFVDHSGKLSTQQAADLLRSRSRVKEIEYDDYLDWLRRGGEAIQAAQGEAAEKPKARRTPMKRD
ncbi:hypothetical protein AB1Y20_010724 [Prymnesium parvum]|uniref:Fatty acid desaturase domain-containing protein n=1 Tax=Prymnesium parvum TaxID=97485 RepID=A0AB34IRT7_PRYPA